MFSLLTSAANCFCVGLVSLSDEGASRSESGVGVSLLDLREAETRTPAFLRD